MLVYPRDRPAIIVAMCIVYIQIYMNIVYTDIA